LGQAPLLLKILCRKVLGKERKNRKSGYYFGVGDEVAERKRSVVYNTAIGVYREQE
jgi:hypothetical protein